MKKTKYVLLVLMNGILLTTPTLANVNTGPAFDNVCIYEYEEERKIEELYQNETNESAKTIMMESLKAAIKPTADETLTEEFLCIVPYSEQLRYILPAVGFDRSWPRYYIDEENFIHLYGKPHNQEEVVVNIENLNKVYNFVNQVKIDTTNMPDEEKVLYLQNLLTANLEYDNDADFAYKLNDVLNKQKGVCTGYSNLFYLCCINIGIKCECVGDGYHMFNRVYLNNEWKYIDTTWNDSANQNIWYLLSESELDENHILWDCFKTK